MARISMPSTLGSAWGYVHWTTRRALRVTARQLGVPGLVVLGCVVATLAAWAVHERATRLNASLSAHGPPSSPMPRPSVPAKVEDDDARIAAFRSYLPPHEDIPQVLQDLMALAEDHQLLLRRGDYKVVPDSAGGFTRYHMILPLQGDSQAIQRFALAALRANPTLALESMHFKREAIGTSVVEARVQWALLTRMPVTRSAP